MLSIINRYCHGYMAVPAMAILKHRGVFDLFSLQEPVFFEEVVQKCNANAGYFQVAVRLMETLEWIEKNQDGAFVKTAKCAEAELFPMALFETFELDFQQCFTVNSEAEKLQKWIVKSRQKWGIEDEWLSDFLDGVLMLPLLLGMRGNGWYSKENAIIELKDACEVFHQDVTALFVEKQWATVSANNDLDLTEPGNYLMDRMLNAGTVLSYAPMCRQMDKVLFGDSASVYARDENGHEGHIERTLNVVASGFQHEKYFKDVEEIILSIFDKQPFAEQPKYVADMGCGDGSLLKRVFEVIKYKSERGKVLDQYPLELIGIDYNEKALVATSKTLGDIKHIVVQGDIGDPATMEEDLKQHVDNIENILHIRSFLDHDRPFIQPRDAKAEQARANLDYQGVYVGSDGNVIAAETAVQSLVEHFYKWGQIKSKYGVIILEVHCSGAKTASIYRDECENMHFDAYHAFSRQYLVEADLFLMSAAEVGLIPQLALCKRYPKVLPFSRITLNLFSRQPYTIRNVHQDDIATLVSLEACLPAASRSSAAQIQQRIDTYPNGQIVLQVGNKVVGVAYSQRVDEDDAIDPADRQQPAWQHIANGEVVELLYSLVPDDAYKSFGAAFIDYMVYYSLLKNEVDEVSGLERCTDYLQYSDATTTVAQHINNYMQAANMSTSEDTIHAELELEAIGARWLLKIYQGMGVMKTENLSYVIPDLLKQLRILPKYEKLSGSLFRILEERGFVSINDETLTTLPGIEDLTQVDFASQFSEFEQQFTLRHPSFIPFMTLMKICLTDYGEVLTGDIEATEVVFPDGSMSLFSGIFRGNKVADHFNTLMAELISKQAAQQQAGINNGEPCRILEIGAGTGGASEFVLPKLAETMARTGANVIYYYTDISSSFTRHGDRRFGEDYPWIKFERLDVEKDPQEQGYDLESFDIIYASNVLHDTKKIYNTLNTVNTMLKQGGLVVLNEFTKMKDLLLYTGGLLHGWWLFEDPENRLKNSCLLSVKKWEKVFHGNGFNDFYGWGLPFESDDETFRQSVMCSTKHQSMLTTAASTQAATVAANVAASAAVTVAPADTANNTANNKQLIIDKTIENILLELLGEKGMKAFTNTIPLMELGLDSIELVELRALINKKLKTNLKTTFFFQYNTVEKMAAHIADSNMLSDKWFASRQKLLPAAEAAPVATPIPAPAPAVIVETVVGQATQPPATAQSDHRPYITKLITKIIDKMLGSKRMQDFSVDIPFMELGLDSIELVELRALLNKKLKSPVKTTFFFQFNTVDKMVGHIHDNNLLAKPPAPVAAPAAPTPVAIPVAPAPIATPTPPAPVVASAPANPVARRHTDGSKDIAVVGISLKFPEDINTFDELWALLNVGGSAITRMTEGRLIWPDDMNIEQDKPYLLQGGFLKNIDTFDAGFFRISPKEAELMDPQQRLLLELCWKTIEDAGYKASELRGTSTGIYIGACHFDYRELLVKHNFVEEAYVATGTNGAVLANRLSYFYDFNGPSMMLDTACSSALLAVHKAMKGLRNGECKQALVGGINLIASPTNTLIYDRAGIISRSGQCSTFDAAANGYVRGEGGGIVMLKTLEQALADGDSIYGVLKGSSTNHGGQSSSLTAPNPSAIANLISRAQEDADITADTISYVEAHGTGTVLGDPIEVEGLYQAFSGNQADARASDYCGLGSIKASVGHLEGAAGIAGLLKVLTMLKHKTIPMTVNYNRLNPEINLKSGQSPFYIADQTQHWQPLTDSQGKEIPRRAGVSAFGFGGANAHVIVEEYQQRDVAYADAIDSPVVFILSAKNKTRLYQHVKQYLTFLKAMPDKHSRLALEQMCYTLQVGRENMETRVAVMAFDTRELISRLEGFLALAPNQHYVFQNAEEQTFTPALDAISDIEHLAQRWASGVDIDWQQHFTHKGLRRINLPTYPFAHERFWIPSDSIIASSENAAVAGPSTTHLHPLLHSNTSDLTRQQFTSMFGEDAFYIRDHTIDGEGILPGVAHLEMARMAGELAAKTPVVQISDVVWLKPIVVSHQPKKVNLVLNPQAEHIDYQIGYKDIVFNQGKITTSQHNLQQQPDRLDITALSAQLGKELPKDIFYAVCEQAHIDYGESFKAVEWLMYDESKTAAMALLKMPANIPATGHHAVADFVLHPSIMDGALQAAAGLAILQDDEDDRKSFMPYTVKSVSIYGTPGGESYSYVRRSQTGSKKSRIPIFDIDICDTAGRVLIAFKGLALISPQQKKQFDNKKLPVADIATASQDMLYASPVWKDESAGAAGSGESKAGQIIMLDVSLATFQTGISRAMDQASVHLLPEFNQSSERKAQVLCSSLIESIKSMMASKSNQQLLIVLPEQQDNYQYRALSALFKTAKIENPGVRAKVVFLSPKLNAGAQQLVDILNVESLADSYDAEEVRYTSDGSRQVSRLEEIQLDGTANCPIRTGGVYWITGGLGGLGLIFTRYIGETAGTRVILSGRSSPSADNQAKLNELRAAGIDVQYIQGDVTDRDSVKQIVASILQKHQTLTGIIHSAGVLRDAFISNKTSEQVKAVVKPKVSGLVYIDEATADLALDFMALCSSFVSVTGNVGQADYAFANAFMDNYAAARHQRMLTGERQGKTIAINWPLWQSGGMQLDTSSEQMMAQTLGLTPMSSTNGLHAFELALNSAYSQVVVGAGLAGKMRQVLFADSAADIATMTQMASTATQGSSDISSPEQGEDFERNTITFIKQLLSSTLRMAFDRLDADAGLDKYGIDSIMAMDLTSQLEKMFSSLPKTLFFEYQTIRELAAYFVENHAQTLHKLLGTDKEQTPVQSKPVQTPTLLNQRFIAEQKPEPVCPMASNQPRGQADLSGLSQDVAIIGVSGRYPQAQNINEFWQNLKQGIDSVTEIPSTRWDSQKYFDTNKDAPGKIYCKWGGFVDDAEMFDPLFFNISPREAQRMDPQERLFLQTAWETMEDAGYTPKHLAANSNEDGISGNVGVYVGVMYQEYQLYGVEETLDGNLQALNGNAANIANRVSYYCDFHGPSMAIDTMCSSSLTAIHLACESIIRGQCELAIAGGVNLSIHPNKFTMLSQGKFASSKGRCESFGEGGDGYVPGEGVGAVLLKPLDQAISDGDHIYAVVKGTSINHGGKTNGYTVPNPNLQGAVISKALKNAGVTAREVSYIEAHGTGTSLGDPIEIAGLGKAFKANGDNGDAGQYCAIGSAKSNIGHCESAAGIAGITKVLLQMRHQQVVPSIHSSTLNPHIDFAGTAFKVQQELAPWQRPVIDGKEYPRVAGISSFGAGGANAHIVLQEYIPSEDIITPVFNGAVLMPVSAKNEQRLKEYIAKLLAFFKSSTNSQSAPALSQQELVKIAYNLQVGREAMKYRVAFMVKNAGQLVEQLTQYLDGAADVADCYQGVVRSDNEKVSLFTDDEDLREAFQKWIKKSKLKKVAELWVLGMDVDWSMMYGDSKPGRMSLPTYPFDKKRYWVPQATTNSTVPAVSTRHSVAVNSLHPLVHKNTSDVYALRFDSVFADNAFYLRDHIINGEKIFPGVAYLEMARVAAVQSNSRQTPAGIKDITWSKPLVATGNTVDASMTLTLNEQGELGYQVQSDNDTLHCDGTVFYNSGEHKTPAVLDITNVSARLDRSLSQADCYGIFAGLGLSYGESFQAIQSIKHNDNEALSRLQLASALTADSSQYMLHPALLDGAFQSVVGLLSREVLNQGKAYVPFAAGSIYLHRAITDECLVYVTRANGQAANGDIQEFDLSIVDTKGNVLVEVKELLFRAMVISSTPPTGRKLTSSSSPTAASKEADVPMNGFTPGWENIPLKAASGSVSSNTVLIFDADNSIKNTFTDKMGAGSQLILVKPGSRLTETGALEFALPMDDKQAYFDLVDTLSQRNVFPEVVVFNHISSTGLNEATNDLIALSCLTQALMAHQEQRKIRFNYVYHNRLQQAMPECGAVVEYFKALSLESSKYSCKVVEFVGHNQSDWLQNMVGECHAESAGALEIQYTASGQRLIKHYQPVSQQQLENCLGQPGLLRAGGVYLVTGGAGGIGLIFAQYLLEQYQAKVVLLGRSTLSDDKQRQIQEMANAGGEAIYMSVDVTNLDEVKALIAQVKNVFGSINGVLHSAGVARTALIANKQLSDSKQTLAPKVAGTVNLDLATQAESLDFFVAFSSISAVIGEAGLSDYAYANGFMDRFAVARQAQVDKGQRQGKTLSINWPVWSEGGMALNEQTKLLMKNVQGIYPIESGAALQVFEQALKLPYSQFVILPGITDKIQHVLDGAKRANAALHQTAKVSVSDPQKLAQFITDKLTAMVSSILMLEPETIEAGAELDDYGFDSITFTEFANEINSNWPLDITPAQFYEHHTIKDLAQHFVDNCAESFADEAVVEQQQTAVAEASVEASAEKSVAAAVAIPVATATVKAAPVAARAFLPQAQAQTPADNGDIAIIGMSAILPDSPNLDVFWQHLEQGVNLIKEVPPARWDWRKHFGDPASDSRKTNSKWGGFIYDVDKFDPLFFNISPPEAAVMDPQHRLFMQTAWHCIEDAGYAPSAFSGGAVGVYVGAQFQDYQELLAQSSATLSGHAATGNAHSMLPNRISYLLNLNGPSEAIDTACSSALVAIHRAVKTLQSGEIDYAIAGGVSLALSPLSNILAGQMGALSDDGQCKTFDKGANGYVKGEGVGAILLKPLHKAIADGDAIHGVIKGSAVNHGGKAKSLTAPNPNAQAKLLVKAYEDAKVNPQTVDYIETHGTGTPLGDPIEIDGLKQGFKTLYQNYGLTPAQTAHIGLGAVKTNIGHLEPAAGIAGVLKVLLSMKHQQLPASINFEQQNPYIKLDDSPFYLNTEKRAWPQTMDTAGQPVPRRAGVSSFGFGGTNAHVVLEAYDAVKPAVANAAEPQLMVLSAKKSERLIKVAEKLYDHLVLNDSTLADKDLASIAYTLQVGRDAMSSRVAFVVDSLESLKSALLAFVANSPDSNTFTAQAADAVDSQQLETLLNLRNHKALAALWVQGADINWSQWYQHSNPGRKHLPGYAFAQQRCWFNDEGAVETEAEKVVAAKPVQQQIYLKPTWVCQRALTPEAPASKTIESNALPQHITVFDKNSIFADALSALLKQVGTIDHTVTLVQPGKSFQTGDNGLCKIRLAQQEDHQKLLEHLAAQGQTPGLVIFNLESIAIDSSISINGKLDRALRVAIHFYQACLASGIDKMRQVYLHGGQQPQYAALSGFIKTCQMEDPGFTGKLMEVIVDNDNSEGNSGDQSEEDIAQKFSGLLLNELKDSQSVEVKYQDGKRWLKENREIDSNTLAADAQVALKQQGRYLITGGMGGIGLVYAKYLAEHFQANLVLTGRQPAGDHTAEALAAITALGGTAVYQQCDIARKIEVTPLVEQLSKDGLNGIIHCAGVINDGLLRSVSKEQLDAVIKPKLYGTLYLDEATKALDLDFFLMCSSLTALLGNVGQSVYAYANGFMDHYAQRRNELAQSGERYGQAISVNWPLWQDGGMTIDEALMDSVIETLGHAPLTSAQGIATLDFVLRHQIEQCYPSIVTHEGVVQTKEVVPQLVVASAVASASVTVSDELLTEHLTEFLTDRLFEVLETRLTPADRFEESGLDSFMSIKTIKVLEKTFGKLRKTLLFEYFNIEKLTGYLIADHRDTLLDLFADKLEVVETAQTVEASAPVVDKSAITSFATRYLSDLFYDVLETRLNPQDKFEEAGLDSFMSIKAVKNLETTFGKLRKTLLFEHYNLDRLSGYFVENHGQVLLDKMPSQTVVLEDAGLQREVTAVASASFEPAPACKVMRLSELSSDAELSAKLDQHKQYTHEATVSRASDLIAPYLFIDLTSYCYFKLNIRQNTILVYSYVGPEDQYHSLIAQVVAYAKQHSCQLNILAYERLESVAGIEFSATPLGALQRITHLSAFQLGGKKMRRLRYSRNKFVTEGECNTVEYTIGSDADTDSAVLGMIDLWCEQKSHVNPTVFALKKEINDKGCIDSRHRVFLTYSRDILQSVVLMTWMPDGYLMDMEFYAETSVYGGQEFTICEIIKTLADEGLNIFSLGGTIGPEMVESANADTDTREILQGLRERGDFGAGNWQFKNKFAPDNQAFYVCKPVGEDADSMLDVLLMMSDPSSDIPEPPAAGSSEHVAVVVSAEGAASTVNPVSNLSTEQREQMIADSGYNPIQVASEHLTFDLMTDSWAQLKPQHYVQTRVQSLQQTVLSADDAMAQMIQGLKQVFPFEHILAVKSGRIAEAIFYQCFSKRNGKRKGKDLVPGNLLFPTGIFCQINEGHTPVECPDEAVFKLDSNEIFKGNLDLTKLTATLNNNPGGVAFVCVEVSDNAAGGYAVALKNLKTIKLLAQKQGVPLVLDVTRIIENAKVIEKAETGYAGRDIWQIVKDICSVADAVTASLAKDFGVNVGGIVATNDNNLYQAMQGVVKAEAGELSTSEISLIANSLSNLEQIEAGVSQRLQVVDSIWQALEHGGVPIAKPSGTHCVLIDVMQIAEFNQLQNPLPSFLSWLYCQTGIRAGVHSAGMQKQTVLNGLVRLAIPVGLTLDDANKISSSIVAAFDNKQGVHALEVVGDSKTQFGDLKTTYQIIESAQEQPVAAQATAEKDDDIAIVGVAGKYPKSDNMREFWHNLVNGEDCISEVDELRWDHTTLSGDDQFKAGAKWGGFINDVDKFDADFFSIPDQTAQNMTPEERQFMQIAWETLEDAGYSPESLIKQTGSNSIGVFVGVVWNQYQIVATQNSVDANEMSLAATHHGIANRVSSFMDLNGPSFTVDSACSSSLTALHIACQSLRSGDCKVSLVGGVNFELHPNKRRAMFAGNLLSASGRCHSFGDDADGYVPGEGVGAVLLKPLKQAVVDGDQIYGVIKSSAVNHVGSGAGYALPNPESQTQLIETALKRGDIDPASIGYIEAHGTGTKLGDSMEVLSLSNVFPSSLDGLPMGSLKSNIGHLEAASGVAGLSKIIMQMKHKKLAASLNAQTTSDYIEFNNTPFYLQQSLADWQPMVDAQGQTQPLRACLNAFGAGGTNAHVVVEEYPRDSISDGKVSDGTVSDGTAAVIIPLSARNAERLTAVAERLHRFIQGDGDLSLADIAHTLQIGRKAMQQRVAFCVSSVAELLAGLEQFVAGNSDIDGCYLPQEGKATADDLIDNKDITVLADAWVQGSELDWAVLALQPSARKISLPTYPFAKDVYWIDRLAVDSVKVEVVPVAEEQAVEAPAAVVSDNPRAKLKAAFVAPDTEVEKQLVDIWCEVMGLDKTLMGIKDNFFEYGGNSLMLTSIANAVKQQFGVELSLTLMFTSPTIEAMSLHIQSATDTDLLAGGSDDSDDDDSGSSNMMEF